MSLRSIAVYPARSAWARTRGLIFMTSLPPSFAMHIKPCWCVHTALLRAPIDIVFLDSGDTILKIVDSLLPWRIAACNGAVSVLEFRSGDARRLRLKVGEALLLEDGHARE